MASRRRQAAAGAAAAGTEKPRLTSPTRRSCRRRAQGAREGGSPGGQGSETPGQPPVSPREVCKTPKRTLRRKSRSPKFSSPVTETDILQEIFWDPYSPVARKGGNGKKKQTTNACTVEISEIVNRIAPQDEKPGSYEGTLLGLWIGDDAIPCTPGIAKIRSRTKVNGARGLQLKDKEEELMKLAKQFDKNLTDAIQIQDASCHNIHILSGAEMSVEQQRNAEAENQQFLGERFHAVTALSVGVIKDGTRSIEHSENHNEMSIDLDAEVALNALFDGPTQKCSGHLSQGLSDCSPAKSSHGSQSTSLEYAVEKTTGTSGETQRQSSTSALEIVEPVPAEDTKVTSKQAIPSIVACQRESVESDKLATVVGDDFDDWDTDLLSDDSFLMHINQNLEQISTVESDLPHTSNANSETKVKTFHSEGPKTAQCAFLKSSNSVPASHTLQEQSNRIRKTKPVFLQGGCHSEIERDSVSKSTLNGTSGCSSVQVKPESKDTQEGFTQLKCIASTAFSGKRAASVSVHSNLSQLQTGKYRSNTNNISHQSSTIPANAKPHDLQKAITQGHLKQAETAKRSVSSYSDWNEPRFSDDVLNSFCESNSLWGANCDEDDDLLYQVCDDIEKRTLSQAVATENGETKSLAGSASKSEVGPCLVEPKQGLFSLPQVPRSHTGRKTFSLDAPITATLPKNKDSAGTSIERSCAPFQNETTNSVPRKWHRSFSVPEGGFACGVGLATISDLGPNTSSGIQWQKGFCNTGKVQNNSNISQMMTEKSKYMFRKTSNSQALVLNDKSVNIGSLPVTHLGLGENKNPPNVSLHTTVQMNVRPVFKRHLSDCFAHSETELKSRKCSQEEIAKKKQEALERRKYKMQRLQKNTAPA
ncbi:ewing's tumor-associated antigen 1 [Tiliqua scincoides]|uniref:ewing's tumor-associated antigen 1 n=1 Tax=Tiliqua scincoides TaxID=71010 RepID=UPI003463388B